MGVELEYSLGEDCDLKVFVWPTTRRGEATFFDCAIYDLQADQQGEESASQIDATESTRAHASSECAPQTWSSAAVARPAESDTQGRQTEAASGDVCTVM